MGRGFQGAILKALGAHDHVVTVTASVEVVPGYVRVAFTSDTLFDDFVPTPAAYLRLWIPDGAHPGKERQRGYTVLDADPTTRAFAVEFVIHEPTGPAATWASRCGRGDELVATVYAPRSFEPPADVTGYVLVGDASAIPAVNSILAAVPDDRPVAALIEYADDAQRAIPVREHPRLELSTFEAGRGGSAIVDALGALDLAARYAWIGAERSTVRAAKAALRSRHGLDRAHLHAQAYWMRGRALGADRDAGSTPG